MFVSITWPVVYVSINACCHRVVPRGAAQEAMKQNQKRVMSAAPVAVDAFDSKSQQERAQEEQDVIKWFPRRKLKAVAAVVGCCDSPRSMQG